MTLDGLAQVVPGFVSWSHSDRIRLISWYLHRYENKTHFATSDIRRCYEALHLSPPSNYSVLIKALVGRDLLETASGYLLSRGKREAFDARYGQRATTTQVSTLLASLPNRIPKVAEREFLDEAIKCLKVGAFRAAIVMTWNLAFDHFANWVFDNHIVAFNAQWPIRLPKEYAKSTIKAITSREEFAELKESQVIEICRSARVITADVFKVLSQKLDVRNSAGHPSDVTFTQTVAEAYVEDLVVNVVLRLSRDERHA